MNTNTDLHKFVVAAPVCYHDKYESHRLSTLRS
jgi:hypothetical protein